jgi:acetyl-CoA acetyltransferase
MQNDHDQGSQRATIVGIATTGFVPVADGKTRLDLEVEASLAAIEDAGLALGDIDGILIEENYANRRYHMEFSEVIGRYETPLCTSMTLGGASPGYAVDLARWALGSGRAKNILVVAGGTEGRSPSQLRHRYLEESGLSSTQHRDYEHPFGPLMASYHGLLARRHMHRFGTTEEQLASVVSASRLNAIANPSAIHHSPVTVRDVLDSDAVSSPIRELHCGRPDDGAVALVLTTIERARDLRKPPVQVLGSGSAGTSYWAGHRMTGGTIDEVALAWSAGSQAALGAFGEAGVRPEDVDLLMVPDEFAIGFIITLEAYGFCEKGDGGAFVSDPTRFGFEGDLPVNTHGGALGCGHVVAPYTSYIEAVAQLRGEATGRQVSDASLAFVGCAGGVASTHFVTLLART